MLIDFELTPLEKVTPWGAPDAPSLHWFALTEGAYWMRAGDGALFEFHERRVRDGASRYCDYQVARLHEDLLAMAPAVLEPLPPRLRPILAAFGEIDDEEDHDHVVARRLCSWHLSAPPVVTLWSDEREAHIAWDARGCVLDGEPMWRVERATIRMSRETFVAELRGFHDRLMNAMAERIKALKRGARPDVAIDFDLLDESHRARCAEIARALKG